MGRVRGGTRSATPIETLRAAPSCSVRRVGVFVVWLEPPGNDRGPRAGTPQGRRRQVGGLRHEQGDKKRSIDCPSEHATEGRKNTEQRQLSCFVSAAWGSLDCTISSIAGFAWRSASA